MKKVLMIAVFGIMGVVGAKAQVVVVRRCVPPPPPPPARVVVVARPCPPPPPPPARVVVVRPGPVVCVAVRPRVVVL